MLKNLKISKKLFVLVFSLLLCLSIVGGSSIALMNKINDASTEIAGNWLPSVIIAEEINTMTSDYRIYEIDHIVTQDAAMMQEYEKKITGKGDEINKKFKEYEAFITNDEDRQLLENAESAWNQYLTLSDKMLAFSRLNDTEQATKILLGDSRQLFEQASNACLKIVDFNKAGAEKSTKYADSLYTFSIITIVIIIIIAIALSLVLSTFIVRLIVKPINEINKVANHIAEGNFDHSVDYEAKDEVGMMAKAFSSMNSSLKIMIEDISFLLGEMSNGNFKVSSNYTDLYIGEYKEILNAIQNIKHSLSATLIEIDRASDEVATSSDQVSNGAQALSQGAMEQASSIEELSATVNETLVHIKENAQNAREANQLIIQSGDNVRESNSSMQEMIVSMSNLSEASNQIEKIVKTIDEIAFQTNILALNAAVEAARAGSAGKGFAVVADEVRNLAQKSAEAVKTTTIHIENVISAIQDSTKIANDTAKSLDHVVGDTGIVAEKMNNIASASQQQAEAITQITTGIDQISSVIQINSATAEESAAASEELNGQAHILKDLISKFQLDDGTNTTANTSYAYTDTTIETPEPSVFEPSNHSKY